MKPTLPLVFALLVSCILIVVVAVASASAATPSEQQFEADEDYSQQTQQQDAPIPFHKGGGHGDFGENAARPAFEGSDASVYEVAPPEIAALMVDMADIVVVAQEQQSAVVFDLGSGTGEVLLEALRRGAKKVVGIERRKDLIRAAKKKFESANIGKDRYEFIHGDVFDLVNRTAQEADVILAWLNADIIARLAPIWFNTHKHGARIVLHDYGMPRDRFPEHVVVDMNLEWKRRITHERDSRTVVFRHVINRENQNSDFAIDWDGTSVFELPARYYGDKIKKSKLRVNRIMRIGNNNKNMKNDEQQQQDARRVLAVNSDGEFVTASVDGFFFAVSVEVRHKRAFMVWFQPYRNCDFTRDDGIPMFEVRVTALKANSEHDDDDEVLLDWTPRGRIVTGDEGHRERPTVFFFSKAAKVPVTIKVETRV